MDRVKGMLVQPEVGEKIWAENTTKIYFDRNLLIRAKKVKYDESLGTIKEVNDKYIGINLDDKNYFIKRSTDYYIKGSLIITEVVMPDLNTVDNTTKTTTNKMGFAAFLPLITSAVEGISSLFGKNADVAKAEQEFKNAQQALLAEKEKTKQAGYSVDVAKIQLLQTKEATAQKKLEEEAGLAKQKQSIGLATLGFVLVFVFGVGYLIVKFVIPIFYSKPTVPQNIVIEEQ